MDKAKILKVFPKANPAIIEAILEYAPRYGITPEQMPMFLAQAGHESGGFTLFSENLNYSENGLANTWPTRYAEKDKFGEYVRIVNPKNPKGLKIYSPNPLAKSIARNPELIANNTYAKRIGNGDVKSGDGWRFRGRGIFQLTGRENYELFAKAHPDIPVMQNPDILLKPAEAVISACWYWQRKKLAEVSKDIEASTKRINGGLIGLADRKHHYEQLA